MNSAERESANDRDLPRYWPHCLAGIVVTVAGLALGYVQFVFQNWSFSAGAFLFYRGWPYAWQLELSSKIYFWELFLDVAVWLVLVGCLVLLYEIFRRHFFRYRLRSLLCVVVFYVVLLSLKPRYPNDVLGLSQEFRSYVILIAIGWPILLVLALAAHLISIIRQRSSGKGDSQGKHEKGTSPISTNDSR